MSQTSHAFYLYCIGEWEALASALEESGCPRAVETEHRVELVRRGELAAVTSKVPLQDYGEGKEGLERSLADTGWAAVRALRHEAVVEFFSHRLCVVPLRFGTLYFNRRRVQSMLRKREPELKALLHRLREREEWGLTVYSNPVQLAQETEKRSPKPAPLRGTAASAGRSYLISKSLTSRRVREARKELQRVVLSLWQELLRASEAARQLNLHPEDPSEHGRVVARFAFLVSRSGFSHFRHEVQRMAEENASLGFKVEMTGPWPPYHFVDKAVHE